MAGGGTPRLEVEGLSKAYGGQRALDEVTLRLGADEILGLAGENGAGKSTLLKIVAGIVRPDAGQVRLNGRPIAPRSYHEATLLGIGMVFQELALVPNLRVYENLFLGHEGHFERLGLLQPEAQVERARAMLARFGLGHVDPRSVTEENSFSVRQMLEIVRVFAVAELLRIEHPVVLLDEPTTGLTGGEVEVFLQRVREVREHGASVIFVSHRLSELLQLCDRIVVLKDGRVAVGAPEGVRTSETSEGELHELMVGRVRDEQFYREDQQRGPAAAGARERLRVERLAIDRGHRRVVEGLSFAVREGEILGLGGLEGSGKSEVGQAIAGLIAPAAGAILLDGAPLAGLGVRERIERGLAYVPRERGRHGVIPYLPVSWNITLPLLPRLSLLGLPLIDVQAERRVAAEQIRQLSIRTPGPEALVAGLSGGNQQKVVLAKWLAAGASVFVLDNPTAGMDVGVRHEIYGLLRQLAAAGAAILLITDDLLELIGLSDRIIILRDGRPAAELAAPPAAKPGERALVQHMV